MKNKLNNKILNDEIKKYPVFYQGEEYEIRVKLGKIYRPEGYYYGEYINIYKVIKYFPKFFNKKQEKIKYKKVYSVILDDIKYDIKEFKSSDENYYIKLFKHAFEKYMTECKVKNIINDTKDKQLAALEKWDGVIE